MASLHKSGKYWYVHGRYKGRQFKLSTKTGSRQMAERALRRIEDDICAGRFSLEKLTRDDHYLSDFFDNYLQKSEGEKSESTIKRDKNVFTNFEGFTGNVPLDQITSSLIEDYKRYLKDSRGFSMSGINIELRHLKAAFSYAVQLTLIDENPFMGVKMMKVEQRKPVFLTKDQARKLLSVAEGYSVYHYILLALHTGARISELASLKWKNIHLEQKQIKVMGKGSKERTIPIHDTLVDYLNTLPRKNEYVAPGMRNIHNIDRKFRKITDACGLHEFRFHDLRHTYASWLAQNEIGIKTIQEILGHESIKTTMIYVHIAAENKRKVLSVIEDALVGK